MVGADHLMYVRGRYDKSRELGVTEITVFDKTGDWTRRDLRIFQRCYRVKDVRNLLRTAGFVAVAAHSAASFSVRGRLAVGRTFFMARKPADVS